MKRNVEGTYLESKDKYIFLLKTDFWTQKINFILQNIIYACKNKDFMLTKL